RYQAAAALALLRFPVPRNRSRADSLDAYTNQLHRVHRFVALKLAVADFRNHVLSPYNLAEDGVLPVPRGHRSGGEEELAPSRIGWTGIGHRQSARAVEP